MSTQASSTLQVTVNGAYDYITACIKAKLVPMLSGSPAIGKSAVMHQIAADYQLKVIDMRLSQCDPTDLLGFPQINEKTGRAGYAPMDTFPLKGDAIPEGYKGWLVFFDELTSAPRGVQAAAYKPILDRMIGTHEIHDKVAIVAAGNLETDGAIVEAMSTALQSRMVHFELTVDSKEWIDWAAGHDIDHRILSFIRFKPDNLYTFKADHTDKTYGSPRTWEFANRFIKGHDVVDQKMLPLLAGTISEGLAREFMSFLRIYDRLLTLPEILAAPDTVAVPDEPSILYALTGAIANGANEKTVGGLMIFVNRLPIEFQVVTLRDIVRRKKELLAHPSVQKWVTVKATDLF